MEEEARGGFNKTAIVLAVISGLQAIFLALIGTGQISFGDGATGAVPPSAAEGGTAPAESEEAAQIGVGLDTINLAEGSQLSTASCFEGVRAAARAKGYEPSDGDSVVYADREGVRVAFWCRGEGQPIVIAAAGPSDRAAQEAADLLKLALSQQLPNDVTQ